MLSGSEAAISDVWHCWDKGFSGLVVYVTNFRLIETWLKSQYTDPESAEFEELSWASNKLIDMALDDPEALWTIIPDILKYDSTDRITGALGAGLLEDLVVHHGKKFIDRIVSLSEVNPAFKKSMTFTFIDENDVSPADYEKFTRAAANEAR